MCLWWLFWLPIVIPSSFYFHLPLLASLLHSVPVLQRLPNSHSLLWRLLWPTVMKDGLWVIWLQYHPFIYFPSGSFWRKSLWILMSRKLIAPSLSDVICSVPTHNPGQLPFHYWILTPLIFHVQSLAKGATAALLVIDGTDHKRHKILKTDVASLTDVLRNS